MPAPPGPPVSPQNKPRHCHPAGGGACCHCVLGSQGASPSESRPDPSLSAHPDSTAKILGVPQLETSLPFHYLPHHHHRMHPNLSDFSFFSFFSFFFLSFFPIAGRRVAFLDPGPKHLHTTYHSNPCSQYMTSIISSRVPNKPAKSQITSQTYQK